MAPAKNNKSPHFHGAPAEPKHSAAREIRKLAAKYEASKYKDKYHCENIRIILKQLEDGGCNWDNDLKEPAIHRFVYYDIRSLNSESTITEQLAGEVRREVLRSIPDHDHRRKIRAEEFATTKRIILLAKGLCKTVCFPPYSDMEIFVDMGCRQLAALETNFKNDLDASIAYYTFCHLKDCRSLQREMEDKAKKQRAALASGLDCLKKVQAALNERDQKIRGRTTNITSDPRSSSLTEKEQTYVNSVTEYAFDEDTKIERDLVDGEIAGLIEKLEKVVVGGE